MSPLPFLIVALLLSRGCSLLTGAGSSRLTTLPSTSNPAFAHNDVHRRQRTVQHMVMTPPKDKNKKVVKVSGAGGEDPDHDVKEHDQPIANGKQRQDYDDIAAPAKLAAELTQGVRNGTDDQVQQNIQAAEDVMELMTEISERMSNGSKEMLGDLSGVMEEKLVRLPEDAASEFTSYLTELTETIQNAQQRELERQLGEFEARFVKPLEKFVFSDAAIYAGAGDKTDPSEERKALRSKLVWAGANSTLSASRRLRTKEMIKNINVAPFYYSVALMMRWVRKVGYPPMLLLTALRSMASVVKTPNLRRRYRKGDQYQEYLKNAEMMQAGWKRTGEIAAKGPMARKWAILRRSAEIWAYFSSFYIKEKRFVSKFNKGKWSQEKLSEERVKLGKEITQNLLKLGPTFIKVSYMNTVQCQYVDVF